MSALGNIIKKEVRELLTPAIILPIVFVAILFGSMGNAIGGIEEQLTEPPVIGIINEDHGELSQIATKVLNQSSTVIFSGTSIAEKQAGITAVQENNGEALIIFSRNFTESILNNSQGTIEIYWIMKGAGILDSISSSVIEGIIGNIRYEVSYQLIQENTTVNASITLSPISRVETTSFKNVEFPNISPGTIMSVLSQQSIFIPIIILMILIMAGNIVITSMAMEKENKTLETLLTLPVKRVTIVAGKIIASALIGLLLAVIYMMGLGNYLQSFQFGGASAGTGFSLTLSTGDLILIGLSLFLALISALSLAMLLGTMAKNYKSAQTLTFPLTLLALIPFFITMFKDFDTLPLILKGVVFAIPLSHPMLATRALLFDDYGLVLSGIVYVTIFALITIYIVVWVFKTDKLLTGSTRLAALKKFKRRKN
ncbi:MAG: ABC transporter permease [Candidatus Thermoplasmatota archaeon]|nr:ABC transporter permease [Candidatus Thermoplasmatota archaeon]